MDDEFSFPIVRDLFEGLTAEDSAGNVEPGVASSWTVSEDGLTYRFHLRENARWSSGEPVTATEFVAGLRHAVDPRTASGSAAALAIIENGKEIIAGRKPVDSLSVFAPQPREVQIKLEHPAPYVLQILSQPIAAPLHAGSCDGPYQLSKRVPGAYVDLVRNPQYWRAASVRVERIRYVTTESEASELRQYLAGELDLTYTTPLPDMQRIVATHGGELQIAPILGTLFIALNMTEAPFDRSPGLRQALSMAVDRELIAANVTSGVIPAYSFVADGIHAYIREDYPWAKLSRRQRLSAAQRLYSAAGFSPQHPLHLRLYFNDNASIRRTMIAVAGNWQQNLGVFTELMSDEFRVFLDERKNHKKWDALRLGWYADYDDAASFLEIFGTANNQDDSGYRNPHFDTLLDAARGEARPEVRRASLESAERVLLDDYPIIPIYFYTTRRLVKPYVGGAAITPLSRTYSRHLYWKSAP